MTKSISRTSLEDIRSYLPNVTDDTAILLRALHDLKKERKANAEEAAFKSSIIQQDLTEQKGRDLYDRALSKIILLLKKISKKRGFNDHPLCKKCENPTWQKEFKENFYKLFIDRERCEDLGNVTANYRQFNQIDARDGKIYDSNLCYGESFAIAFHEMLAKVNRQAPNVSSLAARDRKMESAEGIYDLFKEFNRIATCDLSDVQFTKIPGFFSGSMAENAHKTKELWENYGAADSLFEPGFSATTNVFEASFDRQGLTKKYCEIFLEELKGEVSTNRAIFNLAENLEFNTHLASDANGRAAIFLRDYLMLTQSPSALFPTNFDGWCDDESLERAFSWTSSFFDDPKVAPYSARDLEHSAAILKQRRELFADQNISQYFFYSLLTGSADESFFKEVFFDTAFDKDLPAYVYQYPSRQRNVVTNGSDEGVLAVFDLGVLNEVVEENREAILAEKFEDRSQKIAQIYLQHVFGQDSPSANPNHINLLKEVKKQYSTELQRPSAEVNAISQGAVAGTEYSSLQK
jgi:hypothetical protein